MAHLLGHGQRNVGDIVGQQVEERESNAVAMLSDERK
jgi:hypothetical protein